MIISDIVMAIATIILAVITAFYALRTQEILKIQRKMAEWTAMPQFRFRDFYIPQGRQTRETWVRFQIEGNTARRIRGKIFLKKEDFLSNEIVLDKEETVTSYKNKQKLELA
jgi:hypothetical protein